jgi:predicted DNA-binding protein YlxM (UPF0122 family)
MDDLSQTIDDLDRHLGAAVAADTLQALESIAATQRMLSVHQGDAVRLAVQQDRSWTEIGAALGVSKQAAHQRYTREWAEVLKNELKAEHYAMKAALAAGATTRAAESKAKRDAVIAELKRARRSHKARR